MAVKIRLTRRGKKRQPTYRVVVADSRAPRDGRFIEQIGRYDPRQEPSLVEIDTERAAYWLANGAQPSDQVRKLLEIAGAVEARPVKDRRVHVVGEDAQREAAAEAVATEDEAAETAAAPPEEDQPVGVEETEPAAAEEEKRTAVEASADDEPAESDDEEDS